MRILFLDDDKNRTATFKQQMIGHVVYCTETPDEAKEALSRHSKFDVASLDHDLFGKVFQPSDEKSGFEVCVYIDEMETEDRPEKIIFHSYNPDGVETMKALLMNGIAAPFNSPEYWQEFA